MTANDVTTTLRDAYPFKEAVAAGKTQYFQYTQPSTGAVQVIVTPVIGNPTLHASHHTSRPNATNCFDCVSHEDDLNLLIPHVTMPLRSASNVTYVGVTGSDIPCVFTIRATTITETDSSAASKVIFNTLLNGVVQEDIIAAEATNNYYQLRLPAGHDVLNLNLLPQTGAVRLLANVCKSDDCIADRPTVDNNIYESPCQPNAIAHSLKRNDSDVLSYLLAVESCDASGADASSSSPSSYALTASVEHTTLELTLNHPTADFSPKDEYSRFKVFMPSTEDLFVSVTCLSGDADVYISTDPDNLDRETHMWSQTRWGSDAITIYPDEPNACTNCWYYVAVFGFDDAMYTILASVKSDSPTVIYPGQPQADHVPESGMNYYALQYTRTDNPTEQIIISITPDFGDPDIYVTVSPPTTTTDADPSPTSRPSQSNWDYYSLEQNQNDDRVTIYPNDGKFETLCPLDSPSCLIQVGVYGYHESDYTITASTSGVIASLSMDKPFSGVASSKSSSYFKVHVPVATSTLSLDLAPTSGSPVMFISCSDNYPSPESYEFTSQSLDTDSASFNVEISPANLAARNCDSFPADIFVAIYNNSTQSSSSFTVTATLVYGEDAPPSATTLPHGVILAGDVEYGALTYYTVAVGSGDIAADLVLSATIVSGDVDIFVSESWETRPYVADDGQVTSYIYYSSHRGAYFNEGVTVYRLDPVAHPYYIVAVYGNYAESGPNSCFDAWDDSYTNENSAPITCDWLLNTPHETEYTCEGYFCPSCQYNTRCDKTCNFCTQDESATVPTGTSSYTILAATTKTVTKLMDGVPVNAYVETAQFRYYSTTLTDPTSDLVIAVTPVNGGDPDVYIDVAPVQFPNKTHYTWVSMGYGSDTIVLQSHDIAPHCTEDISDINPCTIYMGVYGYNHTRFSITTSMNHGWSSPLLLTPGAPQSGHVDKGAYVYYKFNLGSFTTDTSSLTFTLMPSDDGDADLYLTTSRDSEPGTSNSEAQVSRERPPPGDALERLN